jgi:exonuclease VII large subunit
MADYSRKQEKSNKENDELVEALLKLPSKNLEARINAIESEIDERHKMRNHVLTKLQTHKTQLKGHKERLKYVSLSGQSPEVLQRVVSDLLKIDNSMAIELKDCFRDISRLKERLQEAREEMEIERQKFAMISDSSKNETPKPGK